jgi:hypothetical protein
MLVVMRISMILHGRLDDEEVDNQNVVTSRRSVKVGQTKRKRAGRDSSDGDRERSSRGVRFNARHHDVRGRDLRIGHYKVSFGARGDGLADSRDNTAKRIARHASRNARNLGYGSLAFVNNLTPASNGDLIAAPGVLDLWSKCGISHLFSLWVAGRPESRPYPD